MDQLDVRGLSCPIPVIKTQKALEKGKLPLTVLGSGNTARQNVTRFASARGYAVEVSSETADEWTLVIKQG